jgi:predicted nucleic acid-binding protein
LGDAHAIPYTNAALSVNLNDQREAMRRQLANIDLIRVDDDLLAPAVEIEPPTARSLDAIRLAAALSLGSDLAAIVTYDARMSTAAQTLGLPVIAPA